MYQNLDLLFFLFYHLLMLVFFFHHLSCFLYFKFLLHFPTFFLFFIALLIQDWRSPGHHGGAHGWGGGIGLEPEAAGDGEALAAQLELGPMGKSRGGVLRSTTRRSAASERGPDREWCSSSRRQHSEGRTRVEERRGAERSVERGGSGVVKPSVFAS
jgi:hypothetical protein